MLGTSGKAIGQQSTRLRVSGARQSSPEHFHAAGAVTLASFLHEWYLQGQGFAHSMLEIAALLYVPSTAALAWTQDEAVIDRLEAEGSVKDMLLSWASEA